jgi:hypothetical protein
MTNAPLKPFHAFDPSNAMIPEACDWPSIGRSLDARGNAVLSGLLTVEQCDALAALYPQKEGYRSRIVMARHGFGRGEYKYFAYPRCAQQTVYA